jgi:glycosyltransferase involved in cell wall biosynthesis
VIRVMGAGKKYSFLFVSAPFGGIQTFFQNLHDVVSTREEVDSVWLSIEREPREFIARIPPISLNLTLKYGLVGRSRIRALEKSGKKFDAAFFNHIVPVSFLQRFIRRVPAVISIDVTPPLLDSVGAWYGIKAASKKSLVEKLKHRLTRKLYADAACLLPWSNWVRNSLVADYGVQEEKIRVLSPGVNLQKWRGSKRGSAGCSQGASLPNATKRRVKVLFVGQEFERKGGDLLVKIAGRAEFQSLECHFVTNDFSGPRGENVFVHSNVQPNSDALISLYREADVFVLPTRAETYGLVILEAMAMGLPVIATRVGGIGEIVVEGETGYMVSVDDEDGLADRLRKLAGDGGLRVRLGENARRLAESKHDLEKNAGAIIDCLIKAANTKPQGSSRTSRKTG